jgi:hypothetical protein
MTKPDAAPLLTRSVIGRLLDELSWVGKSIRHYRDGGVGFENVLVAETMLALDFLPRTRFLGAVLQAATGADETRSKVIAEVEDADLMTLPPETKLRPSGGSYQEQLVVQPDASLIGPATCTLIEAKRLRQGSFQEEQLAREFVSLTRDARDRTPLLLVITPSPPPVPVKKLGRLTIENAIHARLERVLQNTEAHPLELPALSALIPQTVAWVTWDQLGNAVQAACAAFASEDASVARAVGRLCDLVADSLERHR